nr:hypothetical protein [uncultured Flavobacterium sp.]
MSNYTIEDLYKNAVKKKYEEVKNGDDHIYLNAPTRGKLNKLCWEIFKTKPVSTDDKVVFNTLLGFPFDLNTKNTFKSNTNQFRPIETFLKGETDPDKIEVVDLAAILVDFELRPFNKFRKQVDPEDVEFIKDLRDTNFTKDKVATDTLEDKEVIETFTDSETTSDIEEPEQIEIEEPEPTPTDEQKNTSMARMNFTNTDTKPPPTIFRFFAIGVVLIGLGFIIYLTLPDTECMQWSNDHYEIVDCNQETQGFVKINQVELLDKSLINLKKVKVCDTTPCFDKNGAAIIWYAKTANGIDFFNGHGRHPENNKALRPITPYIFNKYVKK